MKNIIDVEKLYFSYQAASVLENITFTVQEGEFIGIFGPNGGGKTTLLHLLMGFLKPTKGKIFVFGTSPKNARRKIGWVPQNFHYDRAFPISVKEVVLGGRLCFIPWHGHFSKEDHKIAETCIEQVGMQKFMEAPFAALSGGQAQRVLIARALASHPALLLLDEPTASIDFSAQTEVYEMLKNLKNEMTIIMVTHDLKNAVDQVDRLFCVQKTLSLMSREKVCEHFAFGLYHSQDDNL